MKKPVFSGDIQNNDDYRRCIRRRMRRMWWLLAAGLTAIAVSLAAKFFLPGKADEYMIGYYLGIGAGLTAAAVVFLIRFRRILKNESKLTRRRISETDERNADISRRAMTITAYIMLGAVYAVGLVGGIFWRPLTHILLAYATLFLVSYVAAWHIYNKKM